ncbi:hypothetical protein Thini_0472 [Thiothrix nivea DSM 5205]|uniref:Uncharacterized protein n=1 Tax=Thiothrix nivea (strain ATCC 35100 / DSM 5205 / JP2) TaxID=870187 RepID=A0A656HDK0_THINJ|nr:hypothetical protein Thini_0472 [Thiothrix nivea DSM 5205]
MGNVREGLMVGIQRVAAGVCCCFVELAVFFTGLKTSKRRLRDE